MSTDNLIKMANQIAQFFASEPDKEQAVKGVRTHLQSFWTPAMRIELMAWQVEHHGESLHPLVQQALAEQGRVA
ncbi:formate dehydrogenase subunit delta [Pseudomonas sp. JS3066]|jgi:formate dehydrogenase subunit delta|uniref:formate dehydrogenase subunit delta n=1 Tax=unclassified Pseudomonas TaxID=196821 RepID=UPI000EAA5EA7|nr:MULTISPECIES: formate dehydrogenase subunit delta [unclassified Pseudomonas]AYF88963.1 formate dehydrogenase [Pseudomonas sp. DY-1]MDH4653145.1 formate dehydrogenase [Pseudomonas sp. BN606]MRK19757.1 formate dehydrogenase subunit delta [Pseudomonas sp. JG-B]WVK93498.1 formate dehydrogenase subunit delta [Pseudomonas sp. JS3066]